MHDEEIGHFFVIELGDDITNKDWTEHLELLVNFWASIFLEEERYKGDPYGPHFTIIGLTKEDFTRWVELFSEMSDEIYIPDISNLFKEKAVHYSKDFMRRLYTDNTHEDLKQLKSKIGWE